MNSENYFTSSDLALVATIALFYPLEAIDRQPDNRRATFLFKRDEKLDHLIESYWKGELKVAPQTYFNSLRIIKARLYGEG